MIRNLDAFLSLPIPVVTLLVLAIWVSIALAIHMVVVPRICGPDGKRLGRFEAEVTSQIALAFGLLISFNAVWLWDRSDRVRQAVIAESSALQAALDESEQLPNRDQIAAAVNGYAHDCVEREWPLLSRGIATTDRTPQISRLRALARDAAGPTHDAIVLAMQSREIRIREGQFSMPPSRWGIVVLLGILTLVSIGALHGDSPRGRFLALALVTLAISFCFVVLVVNGRPFVGDYALQPDGLRRIIANTTR